MPLRKFIRSILEDLTQRYMVLVQTTRRRERTEILPRSSSKSSSSRPRLGRTAALTPVAPLWPGSPGVARETNWISSWQMRQPRCSRTARVTAFFSSRTLPGQLCASRQSQAALVNSSGTEWP